MGRLRYWWMTERRWALAYITVGVAGLIVVLYFVFGGRVDESLALPSPSIPNEPPREIVTAQKVDDEAQVAGDFAQPVRSAVAVGSSSGALDTTTTLPAVVPSPAATLTLVGTETEEAQPEKTASGAGETEKEAEDERAAVAEEEIRLLIEEIEWELEELAALDDWPEF